MMFAMCILWGGITSCGTSSWVFGRNGAILRGTIRIDNECVGSGCVGGGDVVSGGGGGGGGFFDVIIARCMSSVGKAVSVGFAF